MGVEDDLGALEEKLGRTSAETGAAALGEDVASSLASMLASRWMGVVSDRGVVTVVT